MTDVLGGEQHVPRKERAGGSPSADVRAGVEPRTCHLGTPPACTLTGGVT